MQMINNRAAVRLLKMLVKGVMAVEEASVPEQYLIRGDQGSLSICSELFIEMLRDEVITLTGNNGVSLAYKGCRILKQLKTGVVSNQSKPRQAVREINLSESPLASFYRLKSKKGESFLNREEFEAGERLRADFTRANMMPSITSDWERYQYGIAHLNVHSELDIGESAYAARQRVIKALEEVGPELSGLLIDVCCFLKGIQLVERERKWPVRSGKIMLKTALAILARHYNPESQATDHSLNQYHWGSEDYRPSL